MVNKKNKKVIIFVIMIICSIVIAVCLAFVFTYISSNCQCCSPYCPPPPRLEMPMFTIIYAEYNSSNNSLSFAIHNIGETSIITNDFRITIEEYYRANDSFIGLVILNKKPDCKNTTLIPNESTVCSISDVSLDLHNKYYVMIVRYKGYSAQYTLRKP